MSRRTGSLGLELDNEATVARAVGRGFTIEVRLPDAPFKDFEVHVKTACIYATELSSVIPSTFHAAQGTNPTVSTSLFLKVSYPYAS